jgi:hypothetical protein
MKHVVLGLLAVILSNLLHPALAQKLEHPTLIAKHVHVNSAVFSKVEITDTRFDAVHLGFVQRGAFNRKSLITFSQPFTEVIKTAIDTLLLNTPKQEGTLLINLRHFFLSEVPGHGNMDGKIAFKAGFYLKQDSIYHRMFTVDTAVIIKVDADLDVSQPLLDTLPEVFATFIKRAAEFFPGNCDTTTYTAYDIEHINDLEKRAIPVYNVPLPKKGIYASFEEFRNNQPSNENFIAAHKKGFSRPFIYERKENGKKGSEILRKYYYMVCDGEKLYISRHDALYEVTWKDNDFYFTGVGRDVADAGTVVLATALFGVLGGAAVATHDTAVFEFKIDYLTGKLIPVKKIRD